MAASDIIIMIMISDYKLHPHHILPMNISQIAEIEIRWDVMSLVACPIRPLK